MFPGNFFRPVEPGSPRERTIIGAAVATACSILLLDQLTKVLVERNFMLHESRAVIENFFNLSYVRNYGAAWSILSGHGWFLLLVAALVTAAALWFFRYLTEGYAERYFAVFIILGGVAGNSIDRIWRGAVVDFFDLHYHEVYHWPVFNIADIAICAGVGIFVLSSLLRPSRKPAAESGDGGAHG